MTAPRIHIALLGLIALIALIWTLRAAAGVVIPVITAVLAALVVSPASNFVSDRLPPRLQWLGPVCATGLVVLGLGALFAGISVAAGQVIGAAPSVLDRAKTFAETGGAALAGRPLFDADQAQSLIGRFAEPALAFVQNLMGTTVGAVINLVLILFLVLLMLLEAPVWRRKIAALGADGSWIASLEEGAAHVRRFLLARLVLGAITGVLYALWLGLFGTDLLLTWALLALLLNFLPTIGSIIAGTLPAIYVLATRDPGTAIAAAAGLLVIEQVMGNYIDPRVMGKQLSLSPLVVLVALVFWSWVWGPMGALLATPVTVLIVDLSRGVEALRPAAILLGETEDPTPPERGDDRSATS